eukprot:CAMPEP_0119424422 /NCGR_PEP_ID=MMETSP1335-20130426/32519_1 /TAXON_ID=259385 /ORGANISM="Chrysoculter rhomboideus, Strain RCC1486" /LENGTH=64 /DNA_ID=CAMNT_0007449945 /DNA_START=621 /DNA_END=811 /DNA_ORIENTATION=-
MHAVAILSDHSSAQLRDCGACTAAARACADFTTSSGMDGFRTDMASGVPASRSAIVVMPQLASS